MDRRQFLSTGLAIPAIAGLAYLADAQRPIDKLASRTKPISRIAFGSCAEQNKPQPIWDPILSTKPELFLFIGDNIYGDTEDMSVMRAKYQLLAEKPGFKKLRHSVPLMSIWDDHDYGVNDGSGDFRMKEESRQVFFEFFDEPVDSPRRKHQGVYDSRIIGPPGKRVQVILLDVRYNRSKLTRQTPPHPVYGRYMPLVDPKATLLGDAQWKWLEQQLLMPAELRLIASGIQVVAEDHGGEKWMNIPAERQRMFELIRMTGAKGVFFLSGDRHLGELSMMDGGVGYPIYDLTSSGLTVGSKNWRPYEVNRHRVSTMNWGDNFGVIEIDWKRPDPMISLQIRDADGDINIQRKIYLSTLQPGVIPSS